MSSPSDNFIKKSTKSLINHALFLTGFSFFFPQVNRTSYQTSCNLTSPHNINTLSSKKLLRTLKK